MILNKNNDIELKLGKGSQAFAQAYGVTANWDKQEFMELKDSYWLSKSGDVAGSGWVTL